MRTLCATKTMNIFMAGTQKFIERQNKADKWFRCSTVCRIFVSLMVKEEKQIEDIITKKSHVEILIFFYNNCLSFCVFKKSIRVRVNLITCAHLLGDQLTNQHEIIDC
jgi:hypothetical protein